MNDGSHGPIFRLPRPAWHYLFPCLLALALMSLAAFAEYGLLTHDPVTIGRKVLRGSRRWPLMALWGIVLALAPTLPLRYALTSPLVIRKHGLEFDRRTFGAGVHYHPFTLWALGWLFETIHWMSDFGRWEHRIVTWERIGDCHWGRYDRGKLTIHGPDGLVFIPIPERYRHEVEAALRRFDRWQD